MWTTTRKQGAGRSLPSCDFLQWRNTTRSAFGRRIGRRKHPHTTPPTPAALCTTSASKKSSSCTTPRSPHTTGRRPYTILRHRNTSCRDPQPTHRPLPPTHRPLPPTRRTLPPTRRTLPPTCRPLPPTCRTHLYIVSEDFTVSLRRSADGLLLFAHAYLFIAYLFMFS